MLSDVVADRMVAERRRRDWTRDQLSRKCSELGADQLTVAAITNIETGRRRPDGRRRREISVDELVVIAKALDVPPLLLVFPLGRQESLEVLPRRAVPTWPALLWFVGELPFPGDLTEGIGRAELESRARAWMEGTAPISLFRRHALHQSRLAQAHRVDRGEEIERPSVAVEEELLEQIRLSMQGLGLRPPELPNGAAEGQP